MKKTLALIISITMIFTMSLSAFAANSSSLTKDELQKQMDKNVKIIESYIKSKGTTVQNELDKEKSNLQSLLTLETNSDNKAKIEKLIQNYDKMISEYEAYQNNKNTDDISIMGVFDPVLTPAVATIVAYFNMNQYYLSPELLSYANNDSTGGTYSPYYGYRVRGTSEYSRLQSQLRSSSTLSGSGSSSFPNSGGTIDKDLYYSLHAYNYNYNNGSLIITDYYDYAVNPNYQGIAGTAVNTMYMAQTLGVIVPFNVYIPLTY